MSPPDIYSSVDETLEIRPGIPEFYRGKCILVTGATGFMGKILIEKLLRSCPDLDTLYLLMRPKRGHQPEQRLQELMQSKIFNRLREERNDSALMRQIRVVEGDVSKPSLGLTAPVRAEITRHVSIVFHAAATVRFDEPLRNAVLLNTRGTREILALAKDMPNLKAMVHVSTFFSNCQHDHILEEIYPTNADPEKLIQSAEWMDDAWMNALEPLLTEKRPNTYVYTKCLGEKLVEEAAKTLPIAIFRPSIVMSTISEPEPNWVENLNGPSIVVLSGGNGMLKHILCDEDKIAHIVPADLSINAMITLAWYLATSRPSQCEVFNYTPPDGHGLTWRRFLAATVKCYKHMPFSETLGLPTLALSKSKLQVIVSHSYMMGWAYLTDLLTSFTGRKKRLARMQGRVNNAAVQLHYFTTKTWTSDTSNVLRLQSCVSAADQKTFNFDLKNIDWDDYVYQYGAGIRKHIMKEEPSTIPAAKQRVKRMRFIQRGLLFFLLAIVYQVFFSSYFSPSLNIFRNLFGNFGDNNVTTFTMGDKPLSSAY